MILAADRWGPFEEGLDSAERLARLCSLRAVVHLCCGPHGHALSDILQRAEWDGDALRAAVDEFARLEPPDRRRVLATFARFHRPDRLEQAR